MPRADPCVTMRHMAATAETQRLNEREYLAMERASEVKHELWEGECYAMAGASYEHNLVVANLVGALREQLRDRPCIVLASDMKVHAPSKSGFVYPDASVHCGPPQFYDERRDVLLNPTLIVEVLSESTEAFDRGSKFEGYRALPSFREYVLVTPAKPLVERFLRIDEQRWELTEHREGSLALPSLDVTVELAEVYRNVPFAPS